MFGPIQNYSVNLRGVDKSHGTFGLCELSTQNISYFTGGKYRYVLVLYTFKQYAF